MNYVKILSQHTSGYTDENQEVFRDEIRTRYEAEEPTIRLISSLWTYRLG